jgi:hypothetical protein
LCSQEPIVRLLVTNAETNTTASYTNVTASYDEYDFLNVQASLTLNPYTSYTLQIIQQSASFDCETIYRGEVFLRTGSQEVITAPDFTSYDGLQTKYIIW